MEMEPGALRNFKDFLQLYNKMTEICFSRCIDNVNSRKLDENEIDCVDDCSSKFIKFNNKLMQNFVKAQSEIVNKRVADAEQQQLQNTSTNPEQNLSQENAAAVDGQQIQLTNSSLDDNQLVQSESQIIVSK